MYNGIDYTLILLQVVILCYGSDYYDITCIHHDLYVIM